MVPPATPWRNNISESICPEEPYSGDEPYANHFALKYHMQVCTGDTTNSEIISDPEFIQSVVTLAKETSVLNSSSVFKLTYSRVYKWVKRAEKEDEQFCEICQKTFPFQYLYTYGYIARVWQEGPGTIMNIYTPHT